MTPKQAETKPKAAPRKQPAERPPSLTPAMVEEITSYLRSGCSLADASRIVNFSRRSLTVWRERGRIEDERIDAGEKPIAREAIFLSFWRETQTARTRRKVRALTTIQDLMSDKYEASVRFKAASFYLMSGWPDEFGRRTRIEANEPRSEDEEQIDIDAQRKQALAAVDELSERRDRKTG